MTDPKPLRGLRVLEFSHTIMGPCAGVVLADMGADVVKVVVPDDLPCFSVTSDASTGQSAGTATMRNARART